MTLAAVTKLGRYEICSKIGEGGFSCLILLRRNVLNGVDWSQRTKTETADYG